MMKAIEYTVITNSGLAYDIQFPLHPETQSESDVIKMLTELLARLSELLAKEHSISDGDLLQALSMVLAVRARMSSDKSEVIGHLSHELLETALQATRKARLYNASRA